MALKCKCDICKNLVTKWIGMICIPCHDEAIIAKYKASLAPSEEEVIDYLTLDSSK